MSIPIASPCVTEMIILVVIPSKVASIVCVAAPIGLQRTGSSSNRVPLDITQAVAGRVTFNRFPRTSILTVLIVNSSSAVNEYVVGVTSRSKIAPCVVSIVCTIDNP